MVRPSGSSGQAGPRNGWCWLYGQLHGLHFGSHSSLFFGVIDHEAVIFSAVDEYFLLSALEESYLDTHATIALMLVEVGVEFDELLEHVDVRFMKIVQFCHVKPHILNSIGAEVESRFQPLCL